MDNTCYFLGDTIWFKAYVRQCDTGLPTTMSSTLYVDLLNHDGYIVRQRVINLQDGEGEGCIGLPADSSLYSGYYELRAYTRWQLNFGRRVHPHRPVSEGWFFNKATAREYFTDFDKLYSRVFPVYDKPSTAGAYERDMTLRPMLRYYSTDPSPATMQLSLYPEGGHLVKGVENRVAFEATMSDGQQLLGTLSSPSGEVQVGGSDRGRGVFTIVPEKGMEREVMFTTEVGQTAKARLPKPEERGVAMQVRQEGDSTRIVMHLAGLSPDDLAMTITHEGRVEKFYALSNYANDAKINVPIGGSGEKPGVHQATVFDREGRVWADRLFFVTKPEELQPTLTVSGAKDKYMPYERIELEVEGRDKAGSISLAVRDGEKSVPLYDNANIMAEMLLSSEIRGFVPNPGWFFEKDDEEHRKALDLLMMTQGWRRFDWQSLTTAPEIIYEVEKERELTGVVHTYQALTKFDSWTEKTIRQQYKLMGMSKDMIDDEIAQKFGHADKDGRRWDRGKGLRGNLLDGERLRHEVKVYAEHSLPILPMFQFCSTAVTDDGRFSIRLPKQAGPLLIRIAASDTTRWTRKQKEGEEDFQWFSHRSNNFPEFYLRIKNHTPRFPRPFDFYQIHHPKIVPGEGADNTTDYEGQVLKQLTVYARHGGQRRDMYVPPVMVYDAYDAFNRVVDAGLMGPQLTSSRAFSQALAHYLVGDMGVKRDYEVVTQYGSTHSNDFYLSEDKNMPIAEKLCSDLRNLQSIYVYSDFSPRLESDRRYRGSDQPRVRVRILPRNSQRAVYRDRWLIVQSEDQPAHFYSPDYSKQTPPEVPTDYRRTLYWNPDLQLNAEGRARVTLFNNSRTTQIEVDAAGQAADGTLLWNK